VPESPRWLVIHGRVAEAEAIVAEIERRTATAEALGALPPPGPPVAIVPGTRIGFREIARTLLVKYRSRAVLGFVLIASQAFFYNGMSFTYPLVLREHFGVAVDRTGLFVLAM